MANSKKVKGYRGVVTAKSGVLVGGVKRHQSSPFCSRSAAVRWSVVVAQGNKSAGRDFEIGDIETVEVPRRQVVHGCQDGSPCSLRGEEDR